MGESNGDWGALETDEEREAWDGYDFLPEHGTNPVLDSFLTEKNLDHAALARLGGRLSHPAILAFAFEGGIKYRNMVTGKRWNTLGAVYSALKIISGQERDACIVCEGETDGARLTMLYDCDVAIMPVGARAWKPNFTVQVERYERLFVGLDNDEAGEAGYEKIKAEIPHARRFAPPGVKDWCKLVSDPPPLPTEVVRPPPILVSARELVTLEPLEHPSWFADAILPVGGTMVIHATFKSFKTWVALDLAASLAQGRAWASFESAGTPAKVAYLNFEIPWSYYQGRVMRFAETATERDLFLDNYFGYEPLARPHLAAGNRESEDHMTKVLLDGGIQIVVIDPIRRTLGFANPNAEEEVRRLLYYVERLNDAGITVVLVHHDNKESDKYGGGDPAGMTGSGAWAGDVDTIVSISRPVGEGRTSLRRNVDFLLRNDANPSPRGFALTDSRPVEWKLETWVESVDPAASPALPPAPAHTLTEGDANGD